jgi:DNA-directed RNA polymerase specialized sigma24 family protein
LRFKSTAAKGDADMAGTQRDPSLARSGDPHNDEEPSINDNDRALDEKAAPQDAKHVPQDHEGAPQDPQSDAQGHSDDSEEDEEEPISIRLPPPLASGPRLDAREETPQAVAAVYVDNRESAGSDDERAPASHVAPTTLWTYLALPETQKDVRELVRRLLGKETPRDLRDDIAQQACVAALTAKSPPRSTRTMKGWLAMITRRAVSHSFRSGAADRKWLNRKADVEEQAGEPVEPPEDRWLIAGWLTTHLTDERDQETYEMILEKARTGATDREIADAHGITYAAWTHRLSAFKHKYAPRWQRRQMMILLLLGGIAILVAAAVWLVVHAMSARLVPSPAMPVVPVAPSASVMPVPAPVPTPTPFEPAAPHSEDKPRRP